MATTIADISEVLLQLGLSSTITEEERAIAYTSLKMAEGAVKRFLRYDPMQQSRTEFYPMQGSIGGGDGIWEVNDNSAYMRARSGGSDQLQLTHIPIRSITTLHIDYDGRFGQKSGAFADSTLKTSGVDYWMNGDGIDGENDLFCRDGILHSPGLWPTQPGSIKIVYVAGYTESEFRGTQQILDATPILETIIQETVRRMKKAMVTMKQTGSGWGSIKISESLGDYSYSVDGSSLNKYFGGQWDLLGESKERLNEFVNWGSMLSG